MTGVMLVTGGSRGIGGATARLAAGRGWAVAVNYTAATEAADAVVASIRAEGGRAMAFRADVAMQDQVEAMYRAIDAALGPVTALVNNAGVIDRARRVEATEGNALLRLLAVNVAGAFHCAAAAIPRMSLRRGGPGGVIVNVSSAASCHGSPGRQVAYAATKGALDTFTVGLAKELGPEGIRVNAVRPGLIETEMHASGGDPDRLKHAIAEVPLGRAGTADEAASAILWLCSPEAGFVAGAILDVGGGR